MEKQNRKPKHLLDSYRKAQKREAQHIHKSITNLNSKNNFLEKLIKFILSSNNSINLVDIPKELISIDK